MTRQVEWEKRKEGGAFVDNTSSRVEGDFVDDDRLAIARPHIGEHEAFALCAHQCLLSPR
jgi:hypothetical protein